MGRPRKVGLFCIRVDVADVSDVSDASDVTDASNVVERGVSPWIPLANVVPEIIWS